MPESIIAYLLIPFVIIRLFWKSRKQREYLHNLGERFGFYESKTNSEVIWIHAVSVGETNAAEPLIKGLIRDYPNHSILVTNMTPTGRKVSENLFQSSVMKCYLPYDIPSAIDKFLSHFNPKMGIILETEIWPNLLRLTNKRNIPMYLVNARLSAKSARRYSQFGSISKRLFSSFRLVCAQTQQDAKRIEKLGAKSVSVTGSLKFDREITAKTRHSGVIMRKIFGSDRVILLAASTRANEEEYIIKLVKFFSDPKLLTVIVPRHPERFSEVEKLLKKTQINYQLKSSEKKIQNDTKIVLGDSMGELTTYYAACDIAFVGGSLVPSGGQNLLEGCALGKPILVGPYTYNFEEITEKAIEVGAALRVKSLDELNSRLNILVQNPDKRNSMAISGLKFVKDNQGSTERILRLI